MPTPQHGIFALGTRSHHHLELDLAEGADPDELRVLLRELRSQGTTVAGVNIVVGLGSRACELLLPDWLPEGLHPFETYVGPDGYTLPADQHDIWLWLHASGPDAIFDLAFGAVGALDGLATLAAEQPSFTYQASRDLTGFEDGTENPPLDEAYAAATIPDGAPGAGGSVVLVQRFVHDLEGFNVLESADQDQVIGRSKTTGEELPDDVRSERAHISRVVIEDDDGEELEIFRRSTAYGGVLEHGLVFVAFSPDIERLDRMLRRMIGEEDGVRDRLTDFTRSTGGAWYVAPPVEAFPRLMDIADVDPDPIVQFRRWLDDWVATDPHEPMAMVLSTAPAEAGAQPLARHVLLRGVDHRGFAFVTNRSSRKGRHLAENPNACLVFPWFPSGRQVVVTGTVADVDPAESDAYWETRPRGSQIAGSVSDQSQPIPDRASLERRFAELAARYEGRPIPRPDHWGMYRLDPSSLELWRQGENRMHDRLLYERDPAAGGWRITRLSP